ncbi:MAG TPA: hypothetical protein VGF55_13850 [Gemmataceae bacterium]|jgi:hypothetical protein
MRCRNCHTLLADTDTECPGCHSTQVPRVVAVAAAARRDGLLVHAARRSAAVRWGCGGLLLVIGGLAVLIGLVIYLEAQRASEGGPKPMTEADLGKVEDAAALVGTWVAYDSPKTVETGTQLEYLSALKKDRIHSRFVLLRVGGGWMLAEVKPAFTSQHYVGEVRELSHSPLGEKILQDVRRRCPAETKTLLPYYLNADQTYDMGVRGQYVTAGGVALFGLLAAAFAVKMFTAKRVAAM